MNSPATTFSAEELTPDNAAAIDAILANSHPLMVEAFYTAAIPKWYNCPFLKAIRHKNDEREQGLIERLSRYSFVSGLGPQDEDEPAYFVRPEERDLLQRRWIAEDPQAYRTAHRRALAFLEAHPDPNPFAQAQHCLYHRLFVDYDASVQALIGLFRTYTNDHQFAAIERLLTVMEDASAHLTLLDSTLTAGIDGLLIYLKARLAQLRGQWDESFALLERLKPDSAPGLAPYVARAYGYALAQEGSYVEAIQKYKEALALFDRQENLVIDSQSKHGDRAYTLIALGDAYVELAASVRGGAEQALPLPNARQRLRSFLGLFTSLPLVVYLTPALGWRAWHPQFWPVAQDLDWIIARLFVTGVRHYREADHMLETYGARAESVIADEKLAYLYLTLGDLQQAEKFFLRLSAEVEAPLSDYRRASVCLGLGETYLKLGQPRHALKPLRAALPVAITYEDRDLEATVRDALARALLGMEEPAEAIQHLAVSQDRYQAEEKWAEATQLVEHLETWAQSREITGSLQAQIKARIDNLEKRQYPGIFQHRLPIYFRRFVLMVLPIILVIAQLLAITVETGSGLAPEIQFRPAPLLNPDQLVMPNLSLGVTTAQVTVLDNAKVVLIWAVAFILGYVLVSLSLGLAVILLTQLHTVQRRGQGATVCVDHQSITAGKGDTARSLRWTDISRFIKADVRLWSRPARNSSAFGLESAQDHMVIGGNTSHYPQLRQRIEQYVQPTTRVIDLDYAILRSKMGILFVLNLVLIGLFDILAKTARETIFLDGPGIIYSLADLYPYLFCGLIIAPLWWGIIQPLRQHRYLWPRGHFALWVLGLGLLLTLAQIIIRFRPLLTVANLYPPFTAIVIMISAGIALWRAHVSGQSVYPIYVRVGAAAVVALACGLMLSVLWRDARAYHFLVEGNTLRDYALQSEHSADRTRIAFTKKAIEVYARAVETGSRKVWGIETRAATGISLGFPSPDHFVWISALSNQAALQVQMGDYTGAIQNYTVALEFTNRPDRVYAWRALALQGLATAAGELGGVTINRAQYEKAIDDLNKAVQVNPDNAVYYLWRGVAQQALGRFDDALGSYTGALTCSSANRAVCLTDKQRERALTGQGWIQYMRENYKTALDLFWQAKEADPTSAEAWMGEGYTLYTLGLYEDVLPVWETAAALDPKDPTILISLGTLHWKFGGKSEDLNRDQCEEYQQSVDLFAQATERDKLHPQRDKDVAYTYRTLGQVLYLLSKCDDDSRVAVLKKAVDSYSEAIRLDPENAFYWHMRGRLSYTVWSLLRKQSGEDDPATVDWLLRGLADIEKAIALDPVDDLSRDYRPNIFKEAYFTSPLFELSLAALQKGNVTEATGFYTQVLYPEADTVDTAVKFAMLAMIQDDIPEAARWFNEAIRRVSNDTEQYYSRFKASRDHLKALWAREGFTGDALLEHMESQLPDQLEAYPELLDRGHYWRYRAWFKYHVGLSAFMLDAETTARAFLDSAQENAAYAATISTEHLSVRTYLVESGWGAYYLARGDDCAGREALAAALADYEAAFDFITPEDNTTAAAEKTLAAFSAGLTALKLEQPRRAAAWYDKGIALVEAHKNNAEIQATVTPAIEALQSLRDQRPSLGDTADPILNALNELR